MEEFLVAIIEYHYSHQTEFNDKGIAFNGASCFREKSNNTVKVVLSYKTMQLF